jgi:hypothetical protein
VAFAQSLRHHARTISRGVTMSVAGKWNVSMDTPIGRQQFGWDIQESGGAWSGVMDGPTGRAELRQIKVSGENVAFETRINSPMGAIDLNFSGAVAGDQISGMCKTMFGNVQFNGTRA